MRKIFISILTTFLLLVTFSSVTFAWISLPRVNVIEDITFNAKTNTGLEISLDGVNYFTDINGDKIKFLARNIRLTDITSSDGVNFSAGLDRDYHVVKNRDYLSFDLYFRTNTNQRSVYLANNINRNEIDYERLSEAADNTYMISKGISWKNKRDFLYAPEVIREKDSIDTYYLSDAIRISTVEQSPSANYELENRIIKIFDLSEDEQRGFGEEYGAYDFYIKEFGHINIPEAPKTINKLTEFDENNIPLDENETSLITKLNYVDDSGYAKGKITFNIWIEGWDADAFDAIAADIVKIQLAFKSYRSY